VNANPAEVETGGTSEVTALASDPDGDDLTYTFQCDAGSFASGGRAQDTNSDTWLAPDTPGTCTLSVTVFDGETYSSPVETRVTVVAGTPSDPSDPGDGGDSPDDTPGDTPGGTTGGDDTGGVYEAEDDDSGTSSTPGFEVPLVLMAVAVVLLMIVATGRRRV
jgi:hypothetical protein